MSQPVVDVSGLRVVRGTTEVLKGLDLQVGAGSVTGLLGPSGCGKTTLMRAVVGLQAIRDGQLSVLGRPAGTPSLRREIGYSPQGSSTYLDLTVLENVRYFATCIGAEPADVERVLTQVELTAYAHQLTGSLSGGQLSRVSLGISLLGNPRLLVLDEPTVGLDPLLREQLWQLFGDLAASGITLLVSSHVMDEAERCHVLLLMRAGVALAQESPAALKERTSTDTLDAAFLSLVSDAGEAA